MKKRETERGDCNGGVRKGGGELRWRRASSDGDERAPNEVRKASG